VTEAFLEDLLKPIEWGVSGDLSVIVTRALDPALSMALEISPIMAK
jgi:hypothetical protein